MSDSSKPIHAPLPQEVLNLIVNQLGHRFHPDDDERDTRDALLKLASASHRFSDECHRHLFKVFILSNTQGSFPSFSKRLAGLVDLFRNPNGPARHVRELRINFYPDDDANRRDIVEDHPKLQALCNALPHLLQHLNNLESFEYSAEEFVMSQDEQPLPWMTLPMPAQQAIIQCVGRNRIRVLDLYQVTVPFYFLQNIPSTLQTFNATHAGLETTGPWDLRVMPPTPLRARPTVMDIERIQSPLHSIMRQFGLLANVTKLSITTGYINDGWMDIQEPWMTLGALANTLRELDFHILVCDSTKMLLPDAEVFKIPYFPNVSRLEIRFFCPSFCPPEPTTLCPLDYFNHCQRILPYFRNISELSISAGWHIRAESLNAPVQTSPAGHVFVDRARSYWGHIDDMLASTAMFPHLRALKLAFAGSVFRERGLLATRARQRMDGSAMRRKIEAEIAATFVNSARRVAEFKVRRASEAVASEKQAREMIPGVDAMSY